MYQERPDSHSYDRYHSNSLYSRKHQLVVDNNRILAECCLLWDYRFQWHKESPRVLCNNDQIINLNCYSSPIYLPVLTTAVTISPVSPVWYTGEITFFVRQSRDSGKFFTSIDFWNNAGRDSTWTLGLDTRSCNILSRSLIYVYKWELPQYVDLINDWLPL